MVTYWLNTFLENSVGPSLLPERYYSQKITLIAVCSSSEDPQQCAELKTENAANIT